MRWRQGCIGLAEARMVMVRKDRWKQQSRTVVVVAAAAAVGLVPTSVLNHPLKN